MVVDTTLYDLLDVSPTASAQEIRRAYHKKSLSSHPDKNRDRQEEASKEFQQINNAFEVLSDEGARAYYDDFGEEGMQAGGGAGGGGPAGFGGGDDMDDIFESMFGGGMGMGGMGGMGMNDGRPPRRARERNRAPSTIMEYGVTLTDLYLGRRARFQVSRNVFCHVCEGSGAKAGFKAQECVDCKGTGSQRKLASMGRGTIRTNYIDCPACKGEGVRIKEKERCRKCKGEKVLKEKKKLEVKIEPGMRDGQKITFKEQSDCVPGCKKAGNLVIQLRLKEHPGITVRNNDLRTKAQITLSESLLGLERAVFTHLDGRSIRIRTPPGVVTRPGDVCILRGEGLPGYRGDRTGDLYIAWEIEFPRDHWLPQIDSLKMASLLPPKQTDPSRDHTIVSGKVGDSVDESGTPPLQGSGRVQVATLTKGKAEEFGSHQLAPLEEEDDYDDEDENGANANCSIM